MATKNVITASNLVAEFNKEYESNNGKFLLFDLANANENANTKVLKNLLQYNNCQFLNSFLNKIGLPKPKKGSPVSITDQEKAIGPKDTGFIDMYIRYDNVHIIIENKIYGAVDTNKQLARYIATVNGISDKNFAAWYKNPSVTKKTYVVYLTADGTKEPDSNSFPDQLRKKVNYYPINYSADILPWLEEDVMPKIPYAEDGMMIAGVRQYIAFLKQLLTAEFSGVVDAFVNGLKGTDVAKYQGLLSAISENNKDVPENVLKSLRKQLGARAEAIFSGDVADEWVLHFTPSFIILYKKSWAALDTRKYSIPSLYLYAGSTKAFLQKQSLSALILSVCHLSPSMKVKYSKAKLNFDTRGSNVSFNLQKPGIKCSNINDPKARKDFYNKIIGTIQNVVDVIDKDVVAKLQSAKTPATPDMILEKVVDSMSKWPNLP